MSEEDLFLTLRRYDKSNYDLNETSDDEEAMIDPEFYEYVVDRFVRDERFYAKNVKLFKVLIKRLFIDIKNEKKRKNCLFFEYADVKNYLNYFDDDLGISMVRILVYKHNLQPVQKFSTPNKLYNREFIFTFIRQDITALERLYHTKANAEIFNSIRYMVDFEDVFSEQFLKVLRQLFTKFWVFPKKVDFTGKIVEELKNFTYSGMDPITYANTIKYFLENQEIKLPGTGNIFIFIFF